MPELPAPQRLIRDVPVFRFPSPCGAGYGEAHLRSFSCAGTWLIVLTPLDTGASLADSAVSLWAALVDEYGPELVVLEHAPAGDGHPLGLVEQLHVLRDTSQWRRIWPTSPEHPRHAELNAWIAEHAAVLATATCTDVAGLSVG